MTRLPTILVVLVFAGSLALTLGASIVFARRLDRLGSRLGWPEALVGLLTATAADAPELTVEGMVFAGGFAIMSELDDDQAEWLAEMEAKTGHGSEVTNGMSSETGMNEPEMTPAG